jgi:hypothetical protein
MAKDMEDENVMTPTHERFKEFVYMVKVLSVREYKGKESLRVRALKEMGLNMS